MNRSKLFAVVLIWFISALAHAESIRFEYEASVQTVTGTPFGLSVPRLTEVTGYFQYDSTTADTDLFSDERGSYPHDAGGGFLASFLGQQIVGSTTPAVQVEDIRIIDTFRFVDGPRSVGVGGGVMSLNGSADNIELLLAISPGVDAWSSDALPSPFPFAFDPWPEFGYPHTFSLSDEQGTMLLQFQKISNASVPEPSGLSPFAAATCLLFRRRCQSEVGEDE